MKRLLFALTFLTMGMLSAAPESLGQDAPGQNIDRTKLGQTGMKFLSMSVDPRAAALGDAVTALEAGVTSLFYNPAGMARQTTTATAAFGQSRWIADINYNAVAAAFAPAGGSYGVFGLSVVAVDYGEIRQTIRADNEQGFERIGTYSPTAMAVGVGYARSLTDRFSVGGHVKYAKQDLDAVPLRREGGELTRSNYSIGTMVVDFGVLYHTGFRSLNFAMSARNFSREMTYVEENFELPLALQIGVSMNALDLVQVAPDQHALLVSFDVGRPRDYPQQAKFGAEYVFANTLALRAGYSYPQDEQGLNLGGGLQLSAGNIELGVNYAFTDFGILGTVNRVGFQIGF